MLSNEQVPPKNWLHQKIFESVTHVEPDNQ